MKKIGVLRGMEESFPEAVIAYINEKYRNNGFVAEFCSLDAIPQDGEKEYEAILDRISHEVPFYRSYLKWTAIKGTYIVNNPFWWSADDKFIDNVIAQQVGVAVPKTVILPHKNHPPNTESKSFRNLKYPIDWETIIEYIGFPAFMKPHDGGGWRGVTKVTSWAELSAAFDASDIDCMILQENIEFEEYYRCYGIGQKEAYVMRYNPLAAPHLRYKDVPSEPIEPKMLEKLERDVLALCKALDYDMNTVELAVRDGVPYAIDFMNPAPDAEYNSVGPENFEWVVNAVAELLVSKAKQKNRKKQFRSVGLAI
ncbi:MAG: RimK family alpha-L-glutamate ligase [bacterium]